MPKDPAFPLYTQDFLTGTMFMSYEQTGIYIKLLCAQHQHGGLIPRLAFNSIVGQHDLVREKFIETSDGFFNKRLMDEMVKRQQKSSSLSDNAKKRWEGHCKSNAKAYNLHMPIEYENEDENIIQQKQQIQEVFDYFCFTLGKKIILSSSRAKIIENRLKEGRAIKELKSAIDNFSKDEWPDRYKYCDIVYVLGIRNKVDNLDKWLNMASKPAMTTKLPNRL